jgi:internalin A
MTGSRPARRGPCRISRALLVSTACFAFACSLETVVIEDPMMLGTIMGRVTVDGSGMAQVTVTLSGVYSDSTVTAGGGDYSFRRVAGGSYTVTISGFPPGVVFTDSRKQATVTSNGESITLDFEGRPAPLAPSESCADHAASAVASFADSKLEAAVRVQLGVGSGEITCGALAGVTALNATGRAITDLVGIQNLATVRLLDLSDNLISDLAPIVGLVTVTDLDLGDNAITTVDEVRGFTKLTLLELGGNSGLSKIQPLLENPGLGSNDVVGLRGTAVSCDDVSALEARGVTVRSDCGPFALDPDELCVDNPASAIATFEDDDLDFAVRQALSLGQAEDLTCAHLAGLTSLSAESAGIRSLLGIQNLTALTDLQLLSNSISDLGPLRGLTRLTFLDIQWNAVTDVAPLGAITSLRTLFAGGNSISDPTPLSGLSTLDALALNNNPIGDFTVLGGLTNLTFLGLSSTSLAEIGWMSGLTKLRQLWMRENSITSLGVLRGLTSLSDLNLEGNSTLSDIQPLLENAGLGPGDEVNLKSTAVGCGDVASLEAKGVTVLSGCS